MTEQYEQELVEQIDRHLTQAHLCAGRLVDLVSGDMSPTLRRRARSVRTAIIQCADELEAHFPGPKVRS